jgi:hypothetical protein
MSMWRIMTRYALVAAAGAALAGMGVADGLLTGRWGASEQPVRASFERLPLTIGEWDGTALKTSEQLPAAESGTVLLRRYVNRVNGATVTLFLTVGRPGPIVSAHTPDSCYPGAGFARIGSILKQSIAGDDGPRTHEYSVANFSKTERATPLHLRVFWAWSATGAWQSPEYPRLAFAGQPRLFKMYVIRQMVKEGEPLAGDPAAAFIQAAVPEFQKALRDDD